MINFKPLPKITKLGHLTDSSILTAYTACQITNKEWNFDSFLSITGWKKDVGMDIKNLFMFLENKGITVFYPKPNTHINFPAYDYLLYIDTFAIITFYGYDNKKGNFVSLVEDIDVVNDEIKLVNFPEIEKLSLIEDPNLYFCSIKPELSNKHIQYTT